MGAEVILEFSWEGGGGAPQIANEGGFGSLNFWEKIDLKRLNVFFSHAKISFLKQNFK